MRGSGDQAGVRVPQCTCPHTACLPSSTLLISRAGWYGSVAWRLRAEEEETRQGAAAQSFCLTLQARGALARQPQPRHTCLLRLWASCEMQRQ